MTSFRMIAVLTALGALPATAQNIGETFLCPNADGGVTAVIGRTDLLSELAGRDMDPHDMTIVHVQMTGGTGAVAHLAMTEAALAECARETAPGPFDRVAFAEGLDAFMEAVREGTATVTETDPAGAFAAALAPQEG